jgi:DNA helicase-2/ATP-dependent DNA helicase PcrA
MDAILENLNDKQQEAVKATEGKVRVVAGAGSGKTRVLAHRYAYLVNELGIDSGNILCMTFTNKAAQEMKNRIAMLVHRGNINDFVCTIHGFCVKFLRREIHRIGYPQNFIIIDREDAKHIALLVMEEMHLDTRQTTIKKVLEDVGHTKRQAPNKYIERIILPNAPQLEAKSTDEFTRFVQYQLKSFALDFDDLILFTLYIMEHYKDALKYWQDKMNYVMVDEVQDCSRSDWAIINNLYAKYGNLFIVGDPDQCIYEWRGAKPESLIHFNPDTDIILNQNYRSTPNILDVANSIIAHNENRIPKDLFTLKPSSRVAIHFHGKTEADETNWIATQIDNLVKEGCDYSDFAILYRASYLSRNIEQALVKKQIKYAVWGGIRFFERKEIKDCISYLRLIALKDDISFRRIVNTPSRKFGKVSMSKLQDIAEQEGSTLYDALYRHKDDGLFNKDSVNGFIHLIDDCSEYAKFCSVSEILDFVLKESGLDNMYRVEGEDERLENIAELKQSIKEYEQSNINEESLSLDTYLQDIALYTNADYKNDKTTVKLMTIHQAKGLEFPYVFVCGLSEGVFPSHRTIRDRKKEGEEEERRLMYVAVTRAEKALFLTESEGFIHESRIDKYPSRFLIEIKDGLLNLEGDLNPELLKTLAAGTKKVVEELNDELYPKEFSKGSRVEHKLFGKGKILEKMEGGSYKVHFDIGDRFVQSNFLVLSESSNAESKRIVLDKRKDGQDKQIKEERDKRLAVKEGDLIYNSEYGKGVVLRIVEEGNYRKMIVKFNRYRKEKEMSPLWDKFKILDP